MCSLLNIFIYWFMLCSEYVHLYQNIITRAFTHKQNVHALTICSEYVHIIISYFNIFIYWFMLCSEYVRLYWNVFTRLFIYELRYSQASTHNTYTYVRTTCSGYVQIWIYSFIDSIYALNMFHTCIQIQTAHTHLRTHKQHAHANSTDCEHIYIIVCSEYVHVMFWICSCYVHLQYIHSFIMRSEYAHVVRSLWIVIHSSIIPVSSEWSSPRSSGTHGENYKRMLSTYHWCKEKKLHNEYIAAPHSKFTHHEAGLILNQASYRSGALLARLCPWHVNFSLSAW